MKLLKSFIIIIVANLFILNSLSAKELGSSTGLPIPRFVVLKSQEVNLRKGPNVKYPIVWTYQRKGYPMEVIAEFENWRKLRDRDGSEGWVHENLITGIRNAVVTDLNYKTKLPYTNRTDEVVVFRYPDESSYPMFRAELGAILKVKKCEAEWCMVKTELGNGWINKINLWGVYKDEVFK